MAGILAPGKSSLSTESPPFNPGRILAARSQTSGSPVPPSSSSYGAGGHRSRSTSPYPPASRNQQYSQVANPHSNAVPKYTFQYQG